MHARLNKLRDLLSYSISFCNRRLVLTDHNLYGAFLGALGHRSPGDPICVPSDQRIRHSNDRSRATTTLSNCVIVGGVQKASENIELGITRHTD